MITFGVGKLSQPLLFLKMDNQIAAVFVHLNARHFG